MQPKWTNYLWSPGNAWFGFAHRITWTVRTPTGDLGDTERALFLAWGRIGTALLVLAVVTWAAAATGVWVLYNRVRGYTEVTWTDIAFPWQWDERRVKQGRALLARVDGLFEERRWRDGLFHLQVGLGLAPDDLDARVKFAAILRQIGREDRATQVLADGLPFAFNDADYATLAVEASLAAEEPVRVLALADRWFAAEPRATDADRAFHIARARALGLLGRTDEALDAIDRGGLSAEPVGQLVRAQLAWNAGRRDEAVAVLRSASVQHPGDDSLRVGLALYASRAGDLRLAEETLRERIRAEPRLPDRTLDLLRWLADNGRRADFDREMDLHLRRAAGSETVLVDAAKLLARLGRVEEIDRILANLPPSPGAAAILGLCRIDGLIVAHRFPEALADLQRWEESFLADNPHHAADVDVARALASFGLGDSAVAEPALARVIAAAGQLGARGLFTAAGRLVAIGHPEAATRLIRPALDAAADDTLLLRQGAALAAECGDWELVAEILGRILQRPHVAPSVLRELADMLGSDLLLFLPGRDDLLRRLEATGR